MQRAGPTLVLSGEGRELSGLVAILSQPTGVGGRECKTFGYTCRTDVPKIFGREFNSRRLHHVNASRTLSETPFISECSTGVFLSALLDNRITLVKDCTRLAFCLEFPAESMRSTDYFP